MCSGSGAGKAADPDSEKSGNCAVGLRACCADRKKTYIIIESKNPIGTAALEWILRVTVRC